MNLAHQIEPELRSPPPRRVYPREAMRSWRFLQVFILPFALAGLVAACLSVGQICLEVFGQRTTGQVIERRDNSDAEGKNYSVGCTFRVGQAEHQIHYNISESEYQSTSLGQTVPVKYLALGTHVYSIALLPGRNSWSQYAFFLVFTLGWNAIVILVMYMAYIVPRIRRFLYQEGAATVGKITNKKVDDGESTTYTLSYEFTPNPLVASQSVAGHIQVTLADYNAASIGDELTILYNPAKPQSNVSYRYGGYGVEA